MIKCYEQNQRTIKCHVLCSFGLLDFVLTLLYLSWFLRYFLPKTFGPKQFNSYFSKENLLLQDFILKRVNSGCIGPMIIYILLTYKKGNFQPFSGIWDPFSIKPTVVRIKISLKNVISFCPV